MKRKNEIIILLMVCITMSTLLPGCEGATSVAVIDKVTSTTMPQVLKNNMYRVRLAYAVGKSPYDASDIIILDYNGITKSTAEEAINETFAPMAVFGLHNFFSTEDDPINFTTRMNFVSRNLAKRTDIEFRHRLTRAGQPVLRDDGMLIAFGTNGEPGEGRCHLALLNLRAEKSVHAYPEGFTNEELENSTIYPLAWNGNLAHALLILEDGQAVYFACDKDGKFVGKTELSGTGFPKDEQPRGWIDPSGAKNYIIIGFEGGFYLIDTEAFEVGIHRLTPGAVILGPTQDGRNVMWASYDHLDKTAALHKRNLLTATDEESIPFGRALGTLTQNNIRYSYYENCIYFESGNDIWRMDIHTGVYGKFTDTPGEHEKLLWVM